MRQAKLWVLLALLAATAACGTPAAPFELTYTVSPTGEGADILVQVEGGIAGEAWVGFAVGPGASDSLVDRVHSVEARSIDGTTLPLLPYGQAGFRVDTPPGPWTLSYSLDLQPGTAHDTFYRASTRGDDYLVLVGSDAWARFYETSQALSYAPANRPAGFVGTATVNFNLPEFPDPWLVATTVRAWTPRSFILDEHPVSSVFALGPFEILPAPGAPGVRLAVHRDWRVLRDRIPAMTGDLLTALRNRLVELDTGQALALLTPLPEPLQPASGLRTAGMVRGQTLILYADVSSNTVLERPNARLQQAMAVFIGHELFHLYVPSAVAVTRDLSWLSEGWAMQMGRLAALDAGWLTPEADEERLKAAYRRYQRLGGYRAGSLPAASMGSDSQRDLLYLRGELVFRLLAREWTDHGNPGTFEEALWQALVRARDGDHPIDSDQVRAILAALIDPSTVRRYVEGQAPLTPATLGLSLR